MVTALLVDDEITKFGFIKPILESKGVTHIATAESYVDAQRFMEESFDYIITDYNLGDGTGKMIVDSYTKSVRTKAIIYSCCVETVPIEDRRFVISSEMLYDEIDKMINNSDINSKIDDTRITMREKLYSLAETVAGHTVIISSLTSDMKEVKNDIKEGFDKNDLQNKEILFKFPRIDKFIDENVNMGSEIKKSINFWVSIIVAIVTIFLGLIGLKIWFL